MNEKELNPWKTISSKTVYQNPWIHVREDSVIKPDGNPGIYGVVSPGIATGVVAINEKEEVVLVGQYRYPLNEYSWEIIEGGAKPDEAPIDAAQRELQEEAGLIASEIEPLGGEIHLSNCHSSERGLLFIARGLKTTQNNPDDTEVLQIKTLSFEKVLKLVEDGEIKDSLSIIGIYRAGRLLGKI